LVARCPGQQCAERPDVWPKCHRMAGVRCWPRNRKSETSRTLSFSDETIASGCNFI